jgi:hypothetical protein
MSIMKGMQNIAPGPLGSFWKPWQLVQSCWRPSSVYCSHGISLSLSLGSMQLWQAPLWRDDGSMSLPSPHSQAPVWGLWDKFLQLPPSGWLWRLQLFQERHHWGCHPWMQQGQRAVQVSYGGLPCQVLLWEGEMLSVHMVVIIISHFPPVQGVHCVDLRVELPSQSH